MYELFETSNDLYEIHTAGRDEPAIQGNFRTIVRYMCQYLGFDPADIDTAVTEMVRQNHTAAHFGVHRSFIFSFNHSEQKAS